jgi:FtsZ-interacting cell division protein ZipA
MKNYILIDPTKINKEDQTLSEARNPKDWEQRTKTQDEERRAKKAKANQNTSPPPTTTTPATDPPPEKPKKEKEEKKKKENEKEEKKTKPEYVIAAAAEKYLDLEISGKTGFNILGQAAQKVGFGVDVGELGGDRMGRSG